MLPKAIFLSNHKFIDNTSNEGGVKVCTEEYIALIKEVFDVIMFPVKCETNLLYRIRIKLGLNVYKDYRPYKYHVDLFDVIEKNDIRFVFLNLSNTILFAKTIKEKYGNRIKIILCSHGNESGDYLHSIVRFNKNKSILNSILSSYSLGSMLKRESLYRLTYIDSVLTVSPIELALEKWIGASRIMMVPRTVSIDPIVWEPLSGRVGFIGDLSHPPNLYGIKSFCIALQNSNLKRVELRLVGATEEIALLLCNEFSFISYQGYLATEELRSEMSSWSFFLNPVFYYSRGVSTKLAKAIGWGLPVITTSIGCRGYTWKKGGPMIAETPEDMVKIIDQFGFDSKKLYEAKGQIEQMTETLPTIKSLSQELLQFVENTYE